VFQAEDGIRDRNVTGVQTCALPISVERVAHQRMVQRGHVHADLVGAAGLEPDPQQRRPLQLLEGLVVGDRVLAVLAHRELVVVVRKTADRGLDRAARLIGSALADGMVDLADLSGAEGVLQRGVGAFGAGDDHQPAGAHVQAADDPLSLRVTGVGDADARGGEVPEHGGPGPSGAGMRGDADGLVDTTMSSSWWIRLMPAAICGRTSTAGFSSGSSTCTITPGSSRVERAGAAPSTST